MKTVILLIIFCYGSACYSQCPLSLQNFLMCIELNNNDFETFAMENGFFYNTEKKVFMCDKEFKKGAHVMLSRSFNNNETITSYNFFDKSLYLNFKKTFESQAILHNQTEDDNSKIFQYILNDKLIFLVIKTFYVNGEISNAYFVVSGND